LAQARCLGRVPVFGLGLLHGEARFDCSGAFPRLPSPPPLWRIRVHLGWLRALDFACSPRRRTSGLCCREFIRPRTAEASAPGLRLAPAATPRTREGALDRSTENGEDVRMAGILDGKTAVVTGGSKGIGYSIGEYLARAAANVVISARNAGEVKAAADRLNALGAGTVIGVQADVRSYEDVQRMIAAAAELGDGLDILINNAGVGGFAPMDQISVDLWHSIIETNLNGVFYCCREAVPHMRKRGAGWIINIGSLAGKNPFAGGAAYNASKFAIVGFSEAMMLDVREDNIRTSYIMPGSVATYFNDHTPNEADAWKIQPGDIAQIVMDLLAMNPRTLPSRVEVRPSRPPKR
jgi:NAD(P)-dependent dehydrogenase (short-subunit alcohol dehydrogenase family)